MEGLLCLLPDLLRHVCIETQVSFLTGHLSFTGRTTWGRWAPHSADMSVLVRVFSQQFESRRVEREREVWKQLFGSSALSVCEFTLMLPLRAVKSDPPAVAEDFCLRSGWSCWVRPTHTARCSYTSVCLFSSYPTVWINPLITAIFLLAVFCSWREEGSLGRRRKWGACDWVSPPLCCSAHDKPLLFYQDLPSLACLRQIAALLALMLRPELAQLRRTPWPTFNPPPKV